MLTWDFTAKSNTRYHVTTLSWKWHWPTSLQHIRATCLWQTQKNLQGAQESHSLNLIL
jgi:hypothetical protein